MKVDVVERQLNHNMTFQVPVQEFTFLGVKFEILVTKGSPSYSKSTTDGCGILNENPRTIMNGTYSCIFDTNIPGVRYGAPFVSKLFFSCRLPYV